MHKLFASDLLTTNSQSIIISKQDQLF